MKGLYFLVPIFCRNKFEKKIINDLECSCYRIVGNTKYFVNEKKHLWVVMRKRTISIFLDEENLKLEREIRNKMYAKG